MPIEVGDCIAGMDALVERMDSAVKETVVDSLHLIQASAMANAPVGVPGNSTNAPGDLARSMDVEGPTGGDGVYTGKVGPTTIYGRQRELGGPIFPVIAKVLHFWIFGDEVFTHRVFQWPEPYLKPAVDENLANIELIADEKVTVAIEGGV